MRLLLDTQVLVWLLVNRRRLTARERAALGIADELLVSGLSLMELRIKRRAERRRGSPFTVPSPDDAVAFCTARRVAIQSFTPEDAATELIVDPPHGDPFDEMLLAHAQSLGAVLLTRDANLLRHPLAYQP